MKKSLWIAAAAMAVGYGMSAHAVSNAVFGAWSFETLAPGVVIPASSDTPLADPYGTWSADTNNGVAYITNATPANVGFPIAGTHDKSLYFDGSVTNHFDINALDGLRFVTDFLLKPGQLEDLSLLNQVDDSARLAFYFDTNGFFNLKYGGAIALWATSTFAVVYDSNAWVRITIDQDYAAYPNDGQPGFQIALNGTNVSSAAGYTRTGNAFSPSGTWFEVHSGSTGGKFGMNALVGMGIGMLDDVVNFAYAAPSSPFATWMSGYFAPGDPNQGENDDADGDGYSNYKEYIVGTDPSEILSFLVIENIGVNIDGDIVVSFTGSAAGDPSAMYKLYTSDTADGFDFNGTPVSTTNKSAGTINMVVPRAAAVKKFFKIVVPVPAP
jgi:hypothetical protein